MTVTQAEIDALPIEGKLASAAYLLEWLDAPEGETPSSTAEAICSGWNDLLRWLLFPFLEPAKRDGPYTVYCGTSETFKSITQTADALGIEAGLIRECELGQDPEADDPFLARCIGELLDATS